MDTKLIAKLFVVKTQAKTLSENPVRLEQKDASS
jgi:hypothetical protein